MKHGVDVARQHAPDAVALLPRRAKPAGGVAAAEEARAVSRRERGRLVEKEQLGPAAAAHHLAPPALEFTDASEPRLASPSPRQGFRYGVVDDAAVAGEQSAMRGSDDVACWRDPVLQRRSHFRPNFSAVIARSASDEAIHFTDFAAPWIASLRSQ